MPTPPTAPPVIFNIQGRVPANDLNINQIGNYMRSVYQNLALSQSAGVMSARLKQKVAYRDIMGRETLLQRRQEQLADLSDQIAQYYGEFGSVLNDRALDFLNKQAQISVPTFTSILAGFENARASRADMEKKRLDELERLMNLDAGLQRERMALRKEQLDAQNMVAQAALEGQGKMAAGRIEAAGEGLKALHYSGTGHDLPAPQYLSAPYEQQPRIPGLGGLGSLGGGGGRAAAKAAEEKADLSRLINERTTATETPPKETTGTPEKREKVEGDVMSEVFGKGTTILYNTGNAVNAVRNGGAFADPSKFAEARETYRTYFKENPDALKKMEEYAPGFTELLASDDTTPDKLGEKFVEAWGKSEQVHMQNVPGEVGAATKATTTSANQSSAQTSASSEFVEGLKKGTLQTGEAAIRALIPESDLAIDAVKLALNQPAAPAAPAAPTTKQDKKETSSVLDTVFGLGTAHAAELTPVTKEQIALVNAGGVPREGEGGETVLTTNANAAATSSTTVGTQSNQSARQPVVQNTSSGVPLPEDLGRVPNPNYSDTGELYPEMTSTAGERRRSYEDVEVDVDNAWQRAVNDPSGPSISYEDINKSPYQVPDNYSWNKIQEQNADVLLPYEREGADLTVIPQSRNIHPWSPVGMSYQLEANKEYEQRINEILSKLEPRMSAYSDEDKQRIYNNFSAGIRERLPSVEDVDFVNRALFAGYSPADIVNAYRLRLGPGYDRMTYLHRAAKPVNSPSEYVVGARGNQPQPPSSPQIDWTNIWTSQDLSQSQTQGEESTDSTSSEQGTQSAASATPAAPAAPATPAAPAQPNYDEFFDDVNNQRSMRPFGPAQQQVQPQIQPQVQPETTYSDPWYNPDVSGTIQVGTGAENTRVPLRVAAGRLPGDNRVVRLTDGNGNFYDVPASMLGPAQSNGRFTRGQAAPRGTYDDWTVLNAQDRVLRDANQLDINLVEDAFARMYANTMTTPGVGEWYPLSGNPSQNNMAPRFYPAQERQTAPISPEVKAFMDAKMRAMGQVLQKRQQAGQDLHAPITEEEASGSGGTLQKDEVPSVLLNQYDKMQMDLVSRQQISEQQPYLQANSHGNAVWDTPGLNTGQSKGNVKPSGNIRTKSGVNLNGINDELMTRVNTLADILNNEFGIPLIVSSGVRSKAEQAALIRSGRGHKPAAPGRSRHQTGDAIDLALNSMKPYFERSQRAKAQYGNFKNFWTNMVGRVGLYQFDPHGSDPFHHTLPRGTQGSQNKKKKIAEELSIDQMRQMLGGGGFSRSSGTGAIWGAPEGDYARAIAFNGAKGRKITGWGYGANQAQPHDFSTSPLFGQFVNRTVRETGVNPQHAATFLNLILNASAMGESRLGSAQIGFDPKDKGTFQIRDSTFTGLKTGNRTYTRGLDPAFSRKLAAARDVYDMTTEEQAILSLINAASAQGPFKAMIRQGANAVASGNTQAIRDAMVDYIITLHWAGGSPQKALANMQAAINSAARQGKKNRYGVASAQEYYNRKLLPLYRKQADNLLNFLSRGR